MADSKPYYSPVEVTWWGLRWSRTVLWPCNPRTSSWSIPIFSWDAVKVLTSHTAIAWQGGLFSPVSVCGCVCVCVCVCQLNNDWTAWDIIMKFLRERDIVRSLKEFKNGCIPTHCSMQGGVCLIDVLVLNYTMSSPTLHVMIDALWTPTWTFTAKWHVVRVHCAVVVHIHTVECI